MARNSAANLVGLAALGALGYKMLQDKKGSSAPAEDRAATPVSSPTVGSFDANETSWPERPDAGDASVAEAVQNAPRVTPTATAAPKAAAPKSFTGSGIPMGDKLRQADRAIQAKADTDAETARLLARKPKTTLADRQAQDRENFLKNSPLIAGPRAAGQFFEGADRRYLQSKLDRGEALTPLEKAQAKRAGMETFKRGGAVKAKKMASGGMTRSSASKRADGIATKGKTRGKLY